MVEFTPAILARILLSGFKGLVLENRNDYTVIEPVINVDIPIPEKAYTIRIDNERCRKMINEILSLNMKFYIDEQFVK